MEGLEQIVRNKIEEVKKAGNYLAIIEGYELDPDLTTKLRKEGYMVSYNGKYVVSW